MLSRRNALIGAGAAGLANLIPSISFSGTLQKLKANYDREQDYDQLSGETFVHDGIERWKLGWEIVKELSKLGAFDNDKIMRFPVEGIHYDKPHRLPYKHPYYLRTDYACACSRAFHIRWFLKDILFEKYEDVARETAAHIKVEMDEWIDRQQAQISYPIEYYHYFPVIPVRAVDPDLFEPIIGFKSRYAMAFKGGSLDAS